VQELIDSAINPAVAGHGGFVELLDVKDSKAYLQMGGSCQGCVAADITLEARIERLLKEKIPDIEKCSTPPAMARARTPTTAQGSSSRDHAVDDQLVRRIAVDRQQPVPHLRRVVEHPAKVTADPPAHPVPRDEANIAATHDLA